LDRFMTPIRSFMKALRSPSLGKVLLALVAFSVTEWAAYIALVVFAFRDGGAARVGQVSIVTLVVAAAVAPIGSVLGDRYRRERALLLAYAALALATGATAVAMFAGWSTLVVVAVAAAAAALLTLIRPTHNALLPYLAETPDELTLAYAATGLIQSVSVLLGPLLATLVFVLAGSSNGPALLLGVLSVLLIVGTALVATLHPIRSYGEVPHPPRHAFAREVRQGIGAAWHDPRPRLLCSMIGLTSFELGVIEVVIVVLAFEILGTGDAGVGLLNTALGIGSIIGASVTVIVSARPHLFKPFRAALIATGGPLVATAAAPALAGPMFGISAGGLAVSDVVGVTMLQRLIPDAKLTRVFGVLESMYMLGEGLGAATASILVVTTGPRWTLLIAGAILPLVGFVVRHRVAAFDVGIRVPEEELEVLRRDPIFGVLPGPALERVARNAVPIAVPAGTTVIREGERGDRYYVIVEGSFSVSRADGIQGSLGPGQGFGEIALLRDVPRTATVVATSNARLLAVHRDEFLDALSAGAGTMAHQQAQERLPRAEA
jgi:MFS family permease